FGCPTLRGFRRVGRRKTCIMSSFPNQHVILRGALFLLAERGSWRAARTSRIQKRGIIGRLARSLIAAETTLWRLPKLLKSFLNREISPHLPAFSRFGTRLVKLPKSRNFRHLHGIKPNIFFETVSHLPYAICYNDNRVK